MMRRREFIALLGGAAAAWPLVARAQQRGKLPTIGFLGPASASAMRPWIDAFVARLRELGWVEGRTVAIEVRWAEGHSERFAEVAAEFIRLKVDVIVTTGTAVPILKQATSVIPIVFAISNDPLGSGIVASLSKPGGNATGLSQLATDLAGKRLELLREMLPSLSRVAALGNAGNPTTAPEMLEVQIAARTLGFQIVTSEIRRAEEIPAVIEALKDRADALYLQSDPLMNTNRVQINTLALNARLPTFSGIRDYVEAGGLMSYGPNFPDLFRRAAEFVDKILRGAKPADLPVEQPTRFDLVVNLKTAKALGLTVPDSLLGRADEVIE
jgi:putative tryptophan/tyrosine transport system substrate-binding protein